MAICNITCANDADFYRSFVYKTKTTGSPIDLTGVDMVMKLRRHAEDATAFLTLSTDTGEITITNPVGGQFTILIIQDNLLQLSLGSYDQSLIMTINSIKKKIWSGVLVVEAGPSR
jgi:hypothetical protein